MNNIHSQEISHFNLTQNYNKVITYEVQGLSESDLILANAMFFNGRLNDDQKNLTNNPYAYSKGDVDHPLNLYVQKTSNSSEYQNCRTLDLVYQKPVTIDKKTIDVSLSEFGAWGGGYSSKDKITYDLKINIEKEKISLSIYEGQYARTIQLYTDTKTERRKTFDQMFNKKGEIKKSLNNDAKVIVEAINNSISIYFNFIECFKNKKAKIDSEYSIRFNKQLKEDSLAQLKADSLAKIIITISDIPDVYLEKIEQPLCDDIKGLIPELDERGGYSVKADFTGVLKKCEDGKVILIENYLNGKTNGKEIFWHENGQLSSISNWKNGKYEGDFKVWYKNGQIRVECTHENNLVIGTERHWFENGNLEQEIIYKTPNPMIGGVINGTVKNYYENGLIQSEHIVQNNNGTYKKWWENGELKVQGIIKNYTYTGKKCWYEGKEIKCYEIGE